MITALVPPNTSSSDNRARCADGRGSFSHLFFSEDDADIVAAQQLCGECPRQRACLAAATLRREQVGVWGGKVFQNGEPLERRKRRGRPPKHLVDQAS